MVFYEDRELRIELGSAYGAEDEATAQAAITDLIVPQFREDVFGTGIETGISGLIDQIVVQVQAHVSDQAPVVTEPAPVALIVGLSRRRAAKLAATPCPSCGKTGLRKEPVTRDPATQ